MTQVPECTRQQVPLPGWSTGQTGQTQYYTPVRVCAANGVCKDVPGPPLKPADNLYASAAFKKEWQGSANPGGLPSLFQVGAPMRKLVDHLTAVHCDQDWRLTITPTHSEWTKHHQLPATHEGDLTFLDAFSITLERRQCVAKLPSLDDKGWDDRWLNVRNNFDGVPTEAHMKKLNDMAEKHARVQKRALHDPDDEEAHASYWNKRVVRVSKPPYSPPAELCDSVTGYEVRGSIAATTNKIHYTIVAPPAGYNPLPVSATQQRQLQIPATQRQWHEFEEDQPQKRATSPPVDFNRTGVNVTTKQYHATTESPFHRPVMETTTPISELTLQVDFHDMLLESSATQKGRGDRIARAIHTGRSFDYLLWRSMGELRGALAQAASADRFAELCLMARIGGFHVPAAMAALRKFVGGDSVEFGTQLILEYLNGQLYVSLKYLPGTDPIEWPDSDDDDEGEENDDEEREPPSEIGSELL